MRLTGKSRLSGFDMMGKGLLNVGISLPDALLDEFDEFIEKRGYSSRSEGIRNAIRSYISYYEWMGNIKGHFIGTIAIIYENTKRDISDALDVQHHYSHLIRSSVHIYFGQDDCFEVVLLDGSGEEIKKLAEAMMTLKGIKISKLTTLALKEKI
jgi:CopG family nickel-responsive transcriptional regulator